MESCLEHSKRSFNVLPLCLLCQCKHLSHPSLGFRKCFNKASIARIDSVTKPICILICIPVDSEINRRRFATNGIIKQRRAVQDVEIIQCPWRTEIEMLQLLALHHQYAKSDNDYPQWPPKQLSGRPTFLETSLSNQRDSFSTPNVYNQSTLCNRESQQYTLC
jgi:hypothetical protein